MDANTLDIMNQYHCKKIKNCTKAISPTLYEIQKLYPGINPEFDYGLIISIYEYLKSIDAMFIYPPSGKVYILSSCNTSHSLGEILLEGENIYEQRLHN